MSSGGSNDSDSGDKSENKGSGFYSKSSPERQRELRGLEAKANKSIGRQAREAKDARSRGVGFAGYANQTPAERIASGLNPFGSFYSNPNNPKGKSMHGFADPERIAGNLLGAFVGAPGLGAVLGKGAHELDQYMSRGEPSEVGKRVAAYNAENDVGVFGGGTDPEKQTNYADSDGGRGSDRVSLLTPPTQAAAPVVTPPAVTGNPLLPYDYNRSWWEGNKFNVAPITRRT